MMTSSCLPSAPKLSRAGVMRTEPGMCLARKPQSLSPITSLGGLWDASLARTSSRERTGIVLRSTISGLLQLLRQGLHAVPAPVDAVADDEAVLELHHLDEIRLLSGRCLARILPN